MDDLPKRTAALIALLRAMPGAEGAPMATARSAKPLVMIFKLMGKMFAIVSLRGDENVILKCDPTLAEMLRAKYAGVGHRSHLDRRFWISVALGADVPMKEVRRLCAHAYDQVRAGLSKKQQAALAAHGG